MPRIFLSHTSQDRRFVETVLNPLLKGAGIETWYSTDDIPMASKWEREILQGLRSCDWFVIVLSPRSLQSEWVRDEVHWAIDNRQNRIVPVFLEDCNPADLHIRLPRIQAADFSQGAVDPGPKLLALFERVGMLRPALDTRDEEARATAARIAVGNVSLALKRFVLDAAQRQLLVHAETVVQNTHNAPIPHRLVTLNLNGQPLAEQVTDATGLATFLGPFPLSATKLQRANLLQIQVANTGKTAAVEREFELPDVDVEDFDPEDLINEEESRSVRREEYAFRGVVVVRLDPNDFVDVTQVNFRCTINDNRVSLDDDTPSRSGKLRGKFSREYTIREVFSEREKFGSPPYDWKRGKANKVRVTFPNLPDWYAVEINLY